MAFIFKGYKRTTMKKTIKDYFCKDLYILNFFLFELNSETWIYKDGITSNRISAYCGEFSMNFVHTARHVLRIYLFKFFLYYYK